MSIHNHEVNALKEEIMHLNLLDLNEIHDALFNSKGKLYGLFLQHNRLVIPTYMVTYKKFKDWLKAKADFYDCCIEIPSDECKSGHAEILSW